MTPPMEGSSFLTIYNYLIDEHDKYEDAGDGDFDTSKVEEILGRTIAIKPLTNGPPGPVDCTQAVAKFVEATLRSLRIDHDQKVTEMLVSSFETRIKSICNTFRVLRGRQKNNQPTGYKSAIQQALKMYGFDPLQLQDHYEQSIVEPLLDLMANWNKIIDDQKNKTSLKVICDADSHTSDISGDGANTLDGGSAHVEANDQKIPVDEAIGKEKGEERMPPRAQSPVIEEPVVKNDATQHLVDKESIKNEDCLSVRNNEDVYEGKAEEMDNNKGEKDVPVADKGKKSQETKETENEMDSTVKKTRSTPKGRRGRPSLTTKEVPVADEEGASKANNQENDVVAGKKRMMSLAKNARKRPSTKVEELEQKPDDEHENSSSEVKVEAEPAKKRGRPFNAVKTPERNSLGMPPPLKRKSEAHVQDEDVGVKMAAVELPSPRSRMGVKKIAVEVLSSRPRRSCTENKYTVKPPSKGEKHARNRSAIPQEHAADVHPVPATELQDQTIVQTSISPKEEAVVSPQPLVSPFDTAKQPSKGYKHARKRGTIPQEQAPDVHPVPATEIEDEKTVQMSISPENEAVVSPLPLVSSSDTPKQHQRGKNNMKAIPQEKKPNIHPATAMEGEPEKTVTMSENLGKEAVVSTVSSISLSGQLELIVRGTCPGCQHHIIIKQNLASSFAQMEVAPQPSLEAHGGRPEETET